MLRVLTAACVCATVLLAQNDSLPRPTRRGDLSSHAVPPEAMYHRVWAVMPYTGSGQAGDPRRPLLIPAAMAGIGLARQPGDRTGILGYQVQLSDDRKAALVEMVFATPKEFQAFLQSQAKVLGIAVPTTPTGPSSPASLALQGVKPSAFAAPSAAQAALEAAVPGLKMFERGKASDQDILTEFRKDKADFSFGAATVRVP